VRRDLESDSSRHPTGAVVAAVTPSATTARAATVRQLRELIVALDRRVPQIERVGEIAIARAAAEIRSAAVKRIEELECQPAAAGELRSSTPFGLRAERT
jgi:hypothetical protein